ncbi:MAG: tetratricopeptide repeat protein [Thiobacillus sp.]
MKPLNRLGLALYLALTVSLAWAQTPAEKKIEQAQASITKQPKKAELHSALGLAYTQRARETADPTYYDKALAAVDIALKLDATQIEARRVQVWALLGKHEFAKALTKAKALNQTMPDDMMTYAMLADAQIELGQYKEAEQSAQWLLDIRPGTVVGLTRAAYLRELFGDWEGAISLMDSAYQRTAPQETEDRAWLLTQLSHLHLGAGRVSEAGIVANEALKLFPDYHYAIAQLAKVREAQGRMDDAVILLRRHVEIAPHPENHYYLARALALSGQKAEAKTRYALFEKAAVSESARWDNANRELIHYWADHGRADAALKLARQEIARRQDINTRASLAWALYRSGKSEMACAEMKQALAIGSRDATLLKQAKTIRTKAPLCRRTFSV